ncbi:MAG: thermonuclease family protein [Actinobacteria bacterium]|nr:thermonuclease family protein [Actinomycetota bacterium]
MLTVAHGGCRTGMGRRSLRSLALIATVSAAGWWAGAQRQATEPLVRVIEAVDGDTIVVAFDDGRTDTVRILGVDTPETKDPEQGVECFGPEAAAYTASQLTGRVVELERDVELRDLYDRRLAYVSVDGRDFSEELLRRGLARFLVIDPNRAHARDLLAAELTARRTNRGLWRACD